MRMSTRLHFLSRCCAVLALLGCIQSICAQPLPTTPQQWYAHWITHPQASNNGFGVYYFRKEIRLNSVPAQCVVHLSGDNRYTFFVNGREVAEGPARSDLMHWPYETVDIAPYLQPGTNVLATRLVNYGPDRPFAQHTHRTAFMLQPQLATDTALATGSSWLSVHDKAYHPIAISHELARGYYVAGPCDSVLLALHRTDWQQPQATGTDWLPARRLVAARPFGKNEAEGWQLVPRSIPAMERRKEYLQQVRRSTLPVPAGWLQGKAPLTIPAGQTVQLLLDHDSLTIGYFHTRLSGGKGSRIKITYSEALYDSTGQKGNRNEVAGKEILGYYDVLVPDGRQQPVDVGTLWLRTFRFVQLDITTADEPLQLHELYNDFCAYPFEMKARFDADDAALASIRQVSWRTARLCAGETYFDCPYYEQLQYIGDTRIQALISLYNSGDHRLMQQAIAQFDQSRIAAGITASRYPSDQLQLIPPFSLYWVAMVHDYYLHVPDTAFVKSMLPGIDQVLGWFERQVNEQGIVANLPWWNFMDWVPKLPRGVPKGATTAEGSAMVSLLYVYALQRAAELHQRFGNAATATRLQQQIVRIQQAVRRGMYHPARGLFADDAAKTSYSQHTNILAVLTHTATQPQALMQRVLSDTSLLQATIYFKFYLFRALKQTNLGHLYLPQLGFWRQSIRDGLTTFPETEINMRSDCHAWSASPLYDLPALVAGISPAAPGFQQVDIAPQPGALTRIDCSMPHPAGTIVVALRKKADGKSLAGSITLPPGIGGRYVWAGKSRTLRPGLNVLE